MLYEGTCRTGGGRLPLGWLPIGRKQVATYRAKTPGSLWRKPVATLRENSDTRERCWKYDWVVEFDIKGAFDNLDHELLL
jgi:hypothetical protein